MDLPFSRNALSAKESIYIEATEIPVRAEYDVVVVGGGLGGVAAAVASARSGARTALVERNGFLGGVVTAGMCCSMFNCFFTSEGELGTTGIALEIADLFADTAGYGLAWRKHKGHIIFDLEEAKVALDELVTSSGADVYLGSTLSAASLDVDRLTAIIVEDKSGRGAIRAMNFVDATGDADLAALSGVRVKTVETAAHSLCFRLGNVDIDEFVAFFRDNPDQYPDYMDVEWRLEEALDQYEQCGTFLFPHGGGIQMSAFRKAISNGDLPTKIGVHDTTDACQMHGMRKNGVLHVITGFTHFNGLDATRISDSLIDGRRMAHSVAEVYRKYLPGFAESFVVGSATNLGVRFSRYIDGDFVLTEEMLGAGVKQPDSVGRSVGWNRIVRHPGKNAWNMQAMRKASFDLPYRCLIPRGAEGLIMGAGRSVSASHPSLLRVMAHTMVVGQAAGTAAALASREHTVPSKLATELVQHALIQQDVSL